MRFALEGGQNWRGKDWRWLRSLEFDCAIAGETFDEYVAEVTHLEEKRRRIATRVEALGGDDRYTEAVSRLRAFKGIGTLTALAFILEIGDFRRFARAEQFMAFLGLVPSEHSSGEKRRLGNITKAGNSHLRKLLVEAAWVSRRYGAASKRLMRERAEVPAHIAGYAERAGQAPAEEVLAIGACRQTTAGRGSGCSTGAGRVYPGPDGGSNSVA